MRPINSHDTKGFLSLNLREPFPLLASTGGAVDGLQECFSGQAIFFIGGGPSFSLSQQVALRTSGLLTYGVNNSAKSFRPHLWSCVDSADRFLRSVWEDPRIMKFVPAELMKGRLFDSTTWQWVDANVEDCPNVYFFRRFEQFSAPDFLTEPAVCWGNTKALGGVRSVMLAALRLITWLGFTRIYLVGTDFNMNERYTYNFPQTRASGAVRNNTRTYKVLGERFELLKPYLEAYGVSVINCSSKSLLNVFPRMELDKAIEIEKARVIDYRNEPTDGLYDRPKPDRPPQTRTPLSQ